MDISERLKTVRGFIRQEDFAATVGVRKNTVGRWERGEQIPDVDEVNKILVEFPYINPIWLLTGEGEMRRGGATYPLAETLRTADITGELGEGFVKIPRYEVAASAGNGATIHSEQIVDHLSFKADWVHNALGVSVKALALINVTGDSMEPTLSEGDLILIDMSHRGVKDNAVYVLQLNGSLLVKRIQHKLDGSVMVKSDNAIYEPERVDAEMVDSLNVIGRVVWCGRRM